jgi:hypothetical protein
MLHPRGACVAVWRGSMRSPLLLRRLPSRAAACALVAAAATAALAPAAGSAPVDKQQQAAQIQDRSGHGRPDQRARPRLSAAEARRDSAQQVVTGRRRRSVGPSTVNRILDIVRDNLASLYRRTITGRLGHRHRLLEATDLVARSLREGAGRSRRRPALAGEGGAEDLAIQRAEAKTRRRGRRATRSGSEAAVEPRADQRRHSTPSGEIAAAVEAERATPPLRLQVLVVGALPERGPAERRRGAGDRVRGPSRAAVPDTAPVAAGQCYDCSGLVCGVGSAGVSLPGRRLGCDVQQPAACRWSRSSPVT